MQALVNPGLTVALALAAGMMAQSVARHLGLPGIVALLLVGVAVGPDGAGLIWPATLGSGLGTIVEFAVAVILFEGGMNLDLQRLRREQRPIRRLITVGALVTATGGTLLARFWLGWDWRTSALFGTLIIVTGPTVVNPLLRRLKVERSVATILEAEGVLGDAIGAIAAVVALEIALHPSGSNMAFGPLDLVAKLGFGLIFGAGVGALLAWLLRFRSVVPNGLENVFILSLVLALFQGASALSPETGIPAVIAAGAVVGNVEGIHVQRELFQFKEQLTVMLIGLLFVLLAADVRLADIYALGARGALAVVALLVVLRPLTVFASTWGSEVSFKQKLFMSWVGPRGIVAAAVASLFAERLGEQGGGAELRALVFSLVAVSVFSAGLMGGLVGRLLGVRHEVEGWVLLGANELSRQLALALRDAGEDVVCVDTDAARCRAAEEAGISVLCGNGLDEKMMARAGIGHRLGALAVTSNDEVNYLFVKRVTEAASLGTLAAAMDVNRYGIAKDVGRDLGRDLGSDLLFASSQDVRLWCGRLGAKGAAVESWRWARPIRAMRSALKAAPPELALFLTVGRNQHVLPVTSSTRFRLGDTARILLSSERLAEARTWLQSLGWQPADADAHRKSE